MLPKASTFEELTRNFRWQIPARYNIGVDISDKWAASDPSRAAIIHVHPDGRSETFSFGWLSETSNRLANVLRAKAYRARRSRHRLHAAGARSRRLPRGDLRSSARSRSPSPSCSDPRLSPTVAKFRRQGRDHQRARRREASPKSAAKRRS
jgi:hypothetical protein